MRWTIVSILAALLVASCSGAASPDPPSLSAQSPVSDGAPTSVPTDPPSATAPSTANTDADPEAQEPPAHLKRLAVAEQDGVRVRIELERNPMPSGEVTRVTSVVRNLEDRPLHWLSDGCQIPVSVFGESAAGWTDGETHGPKAQLFKDLVLNRAFRQPPFQGPAIDFVPLGHLGGGSFGCADVGIVHTIEPNGTIRDTQAWDGNAALRFGPFPTGPVALEGSFGSYWRGKEMPEERKRIDLTLPAWVSGGPGSDWLGPVGVLDAALDDPGFLGWLDATDVTSGHSELLWYRPELHAWDVGAIAWYDEAAPQVHLVQVDPRSGEVLRTVDRAWDQRLDGFP